MNAPSVSPLVDALWLRSRIGVDRSIRVIDCTTHMIAQPVGPSRIESGAADFERGHIPGAIHMDMVQDLSDPHGTYPFSMLKPEQFEQLARQAGLRHDDHVILYGTSAITTITRAWLVFYTMGHPRVSVLDGGLTQWMAVGGQTTRQASSYPQTDYQVLETRLEHIATIDDVRLALAKSEPCLINALSRQQFEGSGGAHYGRPGRIPGSYHLAARELVDPKSGKFLPLEQIAEKIRQAGLSQSQAVIHYCGGGIAASTTAFALTLLGSTDWAVYDNSLLEWSSLKDTPMETG